MKTITLKMEPNKVRQIHRAVSPELKSVLEASVTDGFFSQSITDRIKSYEDACTDRNEQPMDKAAMLKAGFRQDEIDRRKLETITAALNEDEMMDWNDADQPKHYPYFKFKGSSGFAFDGARYSCSVALAGYASRLCFKSDELARYAGQQFADLYKSIIDNKPE